MLQVNDNSSGRPEYNPGRDRLKRCRNVLLISGIWRSFRDSEGSMAGKPANAVNVPRPPTFATAAEERTHRKRMLAAAFRLFSRFGFDEGVAGHITARDPERLDHFWVNPFGMHFGQIRASELILVNHYGEVV